MKLGMIFSEYPVSILKSYDGISRGKVRKSFYTVHSHAFLFYGIYLMLDFNQIYNGKEDFEEAVDVLKEDLYHVHMNDAAPDAFCLIPGHGEIPLMKYFEILDKKGYSRFVYRRHLQPYRQDPLLK